MTETEIRSILRNARIEKGISQGALAKQVGKYQPQIFNFEEGKFHPNLETVAKIADALGYEFVLVKKTNEQR